MKKEGYIIQSENNKKQRKNETDECIDTKDAETIELIHEKGNRIKEQLLHFAQKIYAEQQEKHVNGTYSENNLNHFISSPFIKEEAVNIIRHLHMQYRQQNNKILEEDSGDNCDEDDRTTDSRLIVATCLRRQDITSTKSSCPRVFALDCEMVQTSIGLEVARISLIQFDPKKDNPERYLVILDSYVKPKHAVVDYKTQ